MMVAPSATLTTLPAMVLVVGAQFAYGWRMDRQKMTKPRCSTARADRYTEFDLQSLSSVDRPDKDAIQPEIGACVAIVGNDVVLKYRTSAHAEPGGDFVAELEG